MNVAEDTQAANANPDKLRCMLEKPTFLTGFGLRPFVACGSLAVQLALLAACGASYRSQLSADLDAGRALAAAARYESVRDVDGADDGLLEEIALTLLVVESQAVSPNAERAFRTLVAAGTRADSGLRRVAEGASDVARQNEAYRVLALRGDDLAEAELTRRGITVERPVRENVPERSEDELRDELLAIAQGLDSDDVAVRRRALERALVLPDRSGLLIALRRLAASEPDEALFVTVASLLLVDEEVFALCLTRLHEIASREDLSAVGAAELLAKRGDEFGVSRLDALLSSADARVRYAAASHVALAGFTADRARRALRDADISVRFAYAGAVLRAASSVVF